MENKTYYDWLEVSPKASQEVIEKAYKALVKKYHPDLQQQNSKNSEEIIKKINEAYSILSDKEKRARYDATLIDTTVSKEDYDKLKQELYTIKKAQNTNNVHTNELNYIQQIEQAKKKAYNDAYIEDMKNRGYKIRYKKSFKDYLKNAITIFIIFILVWLIWQIPFIRNWFNNLADNNFVIKIIIDIIKSIYEAIFETLI